MKPIRRPVTHSFLACLALTIGSRTTPAQALRFVDASTAPGGDGAGWSTAFDDLQDALDAARLDASVVGIHVSAGLYRPDRGSLDAEASFELVDGVALLGGFPAGGGPLASRDPVANESILSGDLLGDDGLPDAQGNIPGSSENTRHVVRAVNTGPATRLDGFVIRGGVSAGGTGRDASGANLRIEGGGPEIRQCLFEFARAGESGGGLAAYDSAVLLVRCTFARNGAERGGGAALLGVVPAWVEDCVFEGNVGGSGAGLAIGPEPFFGGQGSDTIVRACLFVGNRGRLGATAGGGLYLEGARPRVSACEFRDNSADGGGGAFVRDGSARFETCLFLGNNAPGDGGGAVNLTTFTGPGSGLPATELLSCSLVGNNGGIVVVGLDLHVVNCTLADGRLPGLAPFETWPAAFGQEADITLANTIVWGNTGLNGTLDERDHLTSNFGTTYFVLDSIVEDWAGVLSGSAFDLDPLFQDPTGPDGDPATVEDNVYRLQVASPAVDSGDPASLPAPFFLDVEGRRRSADGDGDGLARIDMGAYERQRNLLWRRTLRGENTAPTPALGRGVRNQAPR